MTTETSLIGLTLSAGIEQALGEHMVMRFAYRNTSYADVTLSADTSGTPGAWQDFTVSEHALMVGIVFH